MSHNESNEVSDLYAPCPPPEPLGGEHSVANRVEKAKAHPQPQADKPDWGSILCRAAGGDDEAATEVWQEFVCRMERCTGLQNRVKQFADPEKVYDDVLAKTFFKLLEQTRSEGTDASTNWFGWAYRVAHTMLQHRWRDEHRRAPEPPADEMTSAKPPETFLSGIRAPVPDPGGLDDPDEQLAVTFSGELQLLLLEALSDQDIEHVVETGPVESPSRPAPPLPPLAREHSRSRQLHNKAMRKKTRAEQMLAMACIRDYCLGGHLLAVCRYALKLAGELGLSAEWRAVISYAAVLHHVDIEGGEQDFPCVGGDFAREPASKQAAASLLDDPLFSREKRMLTMNRHPRTVDERPEHRLGAAILTVACEIDRRLSVSPQVFPLFAHVEALLAELEQEAGRRYDTNVVAAARAIARRAGLGLFVNSVLFMEEMFDLASTGNENIRNIVNKQAIVNFTLDVLFMCDMGLHAHLRHTGRLAQLLARELGLSPEWCQTIYYAAVLHDMGRLGGVHQPLPTPGGVHVPVPSGGVESYPLISQIILEGVPMLEREQQIVRALYSAHGLPVIAGSHKIQRGARILAVADCLDELLSNRPRKPAVSLEEALVVLARGRGAEFDTEVVDLVQRLAAQDPAQFAPPSNQEASVDEANGRDYMGSHQHWRTAQ